METDEACSGRLGSPVSVWRDAWRFEKAQVYTRSWYTGLRERTGSNYSRYSPSDYSVRYVEFVRDGLTLAEAPSMMRKMLPTDSQMRRRATAFGTADTYRGAWLIGRIRPLLAGDQPCISPWGYAPGIIKVKYYRLRDKAVRVVAELGEPRGSADIGVFVVIGRV